MQGAAAGGWREPLDTGPFDQYSYSRHFNEFVVQRRVRGTGSLCGCYFRALVGQEGAAGEGRSIFLLILLFEESLAKT